MTQHSVEKLGFKSYLLGIHFNFTITWHIKVCILETCSQLANVCKSPRYKVHIQLESSLSTWKQWSALTTYLRSNRIEMNHSPYLNGPVVIWRFHRAFTFQFTTCKLLSSSSPHNCLLVVVCCLVRHSIRLVSYWRVQITFLSLGADIVDCGLPEEGLGPEVPWWAMVYSDDDAKKREK